VTGSVAEGVLHSLYHIA